MRRLPHLLLATAAIAFATPAVAAPAMWKISDADSRIWLFGSIHMMPEGQDWRTPAFDQVLAKAERVYFETDMSAEQQAIIGAEAFLRGVYTDGTLLTDVLDDEQEKLLREVAADIGLPIGPVLAMRPWMAAQAITAPMLVQSGFVSDGVELQLLSEISPDRRGAFETGTQQLDVLASGPEASDVALLMQALETLPELQESLFEMLDLWATGDVEQLDELMINELSSVEGMADRLLYERNQNWMTPIEAMLAGNESTLVIVGAAHLSGDQGVPTLLEEAGYTVERVQ
ncbi:TraB/GumN family protein [Devosia sp. SL43]|uniref:TraB/GumN family protein n=1 Tax=Devosia sp. SL43 TaxID=2806348 RepID=UPI001F48BAC6|nr:TraB/GumN family protein [Devosia sp. SL43]UJW85931.1 TraB/GumN family protein [Devosia sp. SL43]